MCGHETLEDGLNNPSNHERIDAELRESIDIAAEHGIPGLICFSGNRRPEQSNEEGLVACADCLQSVAPYAEEKGRQPQRRTTEFQGGSSRVPV